ncbi:MAG: hypothetical protein AAF658_09520, partial [Myxococcota bacterium]
MALFELFIPATDDNGFNVTARIQADNWMHALRNGLSKLGEGVDVRNVLCDINAEGIDVTEPSSGRVFRIRELGEDAAPAEAPPAAAAPPAASAPPAAGAPPPAVAPPPAASAAPPPAAAAAAAPTPAAALPVPTPVAEAFDADKGEQITRQRASEAPRVAIGRIKAKAQGKPIEDIIADLF